MRIEGAEVLVVGLVRSGLACAELLHGKGARVCATDVRPLDQLGGARAVVARLGVPFALQSPAVFRGRDLIVVSPGVPADLPELEEARQRGVPVVGEVELAGWFLKGPIIGITGSNGKTTTTALVGHILQQARVPCLVGGNIGVPAVSLIVRSCPGQWNVLELSSFQLETIQAFRASVSVALNMTPDHLDRHHTFENYVDAKARLFETQQAGDCAILNADDPVCVRFASRTAARPFWFSLEHPVSPGIWLEDGTLVLHGRPLLRAEQIPLRGRHNVQNTLAAAAAAHMAGAGLESIAAGIRTFPGVEHRLEFVTALRGVSFFNDSKATNVDAAAKALEAFPGRLWVILGGKDKDGDYTVLRDALREKAKAALLIGAASAKIAGHLEGAVRLIDCGHLSAAVEAAFREAESGDTVLLAPACASFDQFENFEHRGQVFKDLVRQLQTG